jgi:hypothetical protein
MLALRRRHLQALGDQLGVALDPLGMLLGLFVARI